MLRMGYWFRARALRVGSTTVCYYNRNQIIETRDGSGNLTMQVYHAECDQGGSMKGYIDEVVGLRLEQGRVYAHQAERDRGGSVKDYNVTALTDLILDTRLSRECGPDASHPNARRFVASQGERYYYSPYGELEVVVDTHFFDYDDDGDVDAEDVSSCGVCIGDYSGDCRRCDADCDRDIDADDYNAIVAYADTLSADTFF